MEYNFNLKEYNTFHLNCVARDFLRIKQESDLEYLHSIYNKEKIFVLGGGANTLFASDYFDGLVAKIENKGKTIVEENENEIVVEVASGENWSDFVFWACKNNYCGLENLSTIPGSVGAAPVQNIGAYGSEAKDTIKEVLVYDLEANTFSWLKNEDCNFAYRYSCFKYQKGNLIIWKVRFLLQKHFTLNDSYKALKEKIKTKEEKIKTAEEIAETVKEIRDSKLPDHNILGNAGSFFKNPIITGEQYKKIKIQYPDIVAFDDANGVKISAGWLIEKCGLKGKRFGNVGMHEKQALVLVNYGNATGKELIVFANKVIDTVKDKFGIQLDIEAHIIK